MVEEFTAVAAAVGALGALFNAVQISRLSDRVTALDGRLSRLAGRVDAMETMVGHILGILVRRPVVVVDPENAPDE